MRMYNIRILVIVLVSAAVVLLSLLATVIHNRYEAQQEAAAVPTEQCSIETSESPTLNLGSEAEEARDE